MITITRHAKERWEERFSGLDLQNCYLAAVRPNKQERKRILQQGFNDCRQDQKNIKHVINKERGIVFAIAVNDLGVVVLTAYPYNKGVKPRKKHSKPKFVRGTRVSY